MVLNCPCSGEKSLSTQTLAVVLPSQCLLYFQYKKLFTKYKPDGGLFFQKITHSIDKHTVMSLGIEKYFTSMTCLKKFALWRPYYLLLHLYFVLCPYKWIHPFLLSKTAHYFWSPLLMVWFEINHPLILHKGDFAMTSLKIHAVGILF